MIKKLYTSQTGIAHMVLILVLVLASVGGVGYVVWSKQKKSSSSTNSQSATQKQLELECKKEITDKDFCKFASNWNLDESYKMTVTSAENSGSSWLIEGNKNDSRMVMTENGSVIMETISIGKTTYTKNVAANNWTNTPALQPETEEEIEESGLDIDDLTSDKVKYALIGKEACGSLTCFKYKVTEADNKDAEQYLWFDDKEYKLRRFTVKEDGETSIFVISYDNVKIEVPSPVVE